MGYVKNFTDEPHLACLYLRGMLPNAAMQAKACPAATTLLHWVGCPPVGGWPGGEYHTDATGGEYIAIPEARRVGVAVARLTGAEADILEVEWGLFCGLPGQIQTVPRGELYAIVMTVARLAWYTSVLFVTDSLPVHNGIVDHRCNGANSDLWRHLWHLVDKKEITLEVRWIKAHLDKTPWLIDTIGVFTQRCLREFRSGCTGG